MQQSAHPRIGTIAPVISLEERRLRRARTRRRITVARPLVALWFGGAIFATAVLLGFATMVALNDPWIGVPVGIAITTLASWQAAGSWLAHRRGDAPKPGAAEG